MGQIVYAQGQWSMGFESLYAFNLAMVTKQGWNLITKPNAMISRIFIARDIFQEGGF